MNEIKMCDFRYDEGIRPRKELVWDTLTAEHLGGTSPSGQPFVMIKQATKEGAISCNCGGVADLLYPTSKTRRNQSTVIHSYTKKLETQSSNRY